MTVSRRVLALISTLALSGETVGNRGGECLELLTGVPVHAEIAAKGIAHLVAATARILTEHENAALAAQLVHTRAVMTCHGEDQVGAFDQFARQEAGAVSREIEAPLEARASASADALNANPCASAIPRSLINKRNGLLADRPFSAASAATSACTAREPSP